MTHLGSRSAILAGIAASALSLCVLSSGPAVAQTALPPYTLSVFAKSVLGPNGYTQPDSIALWRDHVFVGFENHVAKDGTDGKSSTIVQYSQSGTVERMFSVPGHNDGLRVVGDDKLWALQNEDANPNLVIIDLKTGAQSEFFPPAPHGGGYDDLRVLGGDVYISASNPNLDPVTGVNVFPALVRARIVGGAVKLDTVLLGNATATDIPTGDTVTLNLTDPDSLSIDPRGNLVLDDQQDSQIIFIRHPLTDDQVVGRLNVTTAAGPITVDDTAFAPRGPSFLLFSDVSADAIYRLDPGPLGFEPGTAYSMSDTTDQVSTLNLDNGVLTPIATGFISTRGAAFVRPPRDDRDGDHFARNDGH